MIYFLSLLCFLEANVLSSMKCILMMHLRATRYLVTNSIKHSWKIVGQTAKEISDFVSRISQTSELTMLNTLEDRKIAESNRNLRNAVIPDDIIDKNATERKRLWSSTDIPVADLLHNRMPYRLLTHISSSETRQLNIVETIANS